MLKVHSSSGAVELTADQERLLRGLDDEAVCLALNTGTDVYVCAVLNERPQIRFTPGRGWYVHAGQTTESLPARNRLH